MGYEIIIADPDRHQDEILALWQEGLNKPLVHSRFNWLYRLNPTGETTTFLAIQQKTRKIVGCASCYRQPMLVAGQKMTFGIAADFIIQEKHRAFGPALKLQRHLTSCLSKGDVDLLFAFPNPASKGVFIRLGYRQVGTTRHFLRVLDARNKINKIVPKILVPFASWVYNTKQAVSDWWRSRNCGWQTHNTSITLLKRLEIVYAAMNERWPVMVKRDSDYFLWRYNNDSGVELQVFTLQDQNSINAIAAYIIYSRDQRTVSVLNVGFLRDKNVVRRLWSVFSRMLARQGVEAISMTGMFPEQDIQVLRNCRFITRPDSRDCFIMPGSHLDQQLVSVLSDCRNWFLFESEADL